MAKTKFSLQMFQFRIWHKETALINKLKLQYCIFVNCCANVLFKVRSLRIWKSTFPGDTARQLHNTNSLFAHVIKIYDDPCWFSIKLQSHPYVSSEFCFSFFLIYNFFLTWYAVCATTALEIMPLTAQMPGVRIIQHHLMKKTGLYPIMSSILR